MKMKTMKMKNKNKRRLKEKDNINFEDANFVKLGEKSDLKDNEYFKLLNNIIEHKNKSKINDEMENEDKQSMHK